MKIRTTELLCDALANDLAWRKKELSEIRSLGQRKSESSNRRKVLARCGVALLYAHFEGFTKRAATMYFEFVAAQRLNNNQLADNFIALMIRDRMSNGLGSKKPSTYENAALLLRDDSGSRARIPFKDAIDTESNLSSSVLREITWTLGIDYSFFEPKEKLIDSRLLGRRNHIAHGEFLDLDPSDYDNLHQSVIAMLNDLSSQISNAAIQEKFKIVTT